MHRQTSTVVSTRARGAGTAVRPMLPFRLCVQPFRAAWAGCLSPRKTLDLRRRSPPSAASRSAHRARAGTSSAARPGHGTAPAWTWPRVCVKNSQCDTILSSEEGVELAPTAQPQLEPPPARLPPALLSVLTAEYLSHVEVQGDDQPGPFPTWSRRAFWLKQNDNVRQIVFSDYTSNFKSVSTVPKVSISQNEWNQKGLLRKGVMKI